MPPCARTSQITYRATFKAQSMRPPYHPAYSAVNFGKDMWGMLFFFLPYPAWFRPCPGARPALQCSFLSCLPSRELANVRLARTSLNLVDRSERNEGRGVHSPHAAPATMSYGGSGRHIDHGWVGINIKIQHTVGEVHKKLQPQAECKQRSKRYAGEARRL